MTSMAATRQQGKARQSKKRQRKQRPQVTHNLAGVWLLELPLALVTVLWFEPGLVQAAACHSQPCRGCAMFILAGIWFQGRLAPFPAPSRIFLHRFMVKKIEQGRKGAPSHTCKFLSL